MIIDDLDNWNQGFQSGNGLKVGLQQALYYYHRDLLWNDTLTFYRQVVFNNYTRFNLLGDPLVQTESKRLEAIDTELANLKVLLDNGYKNVEMNGGT